MNQVLKAREDRAKQIEQLLEHFNAIICLKANTPGPQKQTPEAVFLVRFFMKKVQGIATEFLGYFSSEDGPYALFSSVSHDYTIIKKKLILLEESASFGRLVDIDLYQNNVEHSRKDKRPCILCEDQVATCQRLSRHRAEEILNAIRDRFITDFHDWLSGLISQCVLDELNLSPKFGLVTPFSSGSHPDMSYSLMYRAKDAILPFFTEIGLKAIHDYFYESQNRQTIHSIGIVAESAMYSSTSGVNAYKGLIFNLGYVIYAMIGVLIQGDSWDRVFTQLQVLSKGLSCSISGGLETFGQKALTQYGVGAKATMEAGLVPVQHLLTQSQIDIESNKLDSLVYLMGEVEDTTLFKRCGSIETYNHVRQEIRSLKKSDYDAFSEKCEKHGYTFGGSADLLIVSLFIQRMRKSLFLEK